MGTRRRKLSLAIVRFFQRERLHYVRMDSPVNRKKIKTMIIVYPK